MEQRELEVQNKKDKGFTLVELLIVIVILGILATVVALSVTAITGDAKSKVCETEFANVETAWEAYYAANGGTEPGDLTDLESYLRDDLEYVTAIPADDAAGNPDWDTAVETACADL